MLGLDDGVGDPQTARTFRPTHKGIEHESPYALEPSR